MEKEMYKTSSDVVLRPVFRLADGFEKAHRLALKNKNDKTIPGDDQLMAKVGCPPNQINTAEQHLRMPVLFIRLPTQHNTNILPFSNLNWDVTTG
eukprot:3285412-Rhodomonas_salina.1